MHVKIVDVDSILELRHNVLRHGKPFESCFYEEDRTASTIHLAAIYKDTIVSCATFYKEKNNHIAHKNSFRLRGMATEEKFRKKGFGKLLLKTAEKIISEKGSNNLWCNAIKLFHSIFHVDIKFLDNYLIFKILDLII